MFNMANAKPSARYLSFLLSILKFFRVSNLGNIKRTVEGGHAW